MPIDRTTVITNLQDRIVAAPKKASLRTVVVPLLAALAVVAIAAYFLQHFPATMLAFAVVLLAIGRLWPLVIEIAGKRVGNVFRGCVDFAGVALLAILALDGAFGEITRALFALIHQ